MNSGSADVNMVGGSADSLSLKPWVRLWCGIKEWHSSTEYDIVQICRHNKKKPNPYRIRLEEAATYSPT